jgi:RNA polymerase sigma-70 factor (ECF subfamily)
MTTRGGNIESEGQSVGLGAGDGNAGEPSVRIERNAAETVADPASQRAARLMRQAQSGDRASFGQMVTLYQDRLFNATLRLVGDAEEASDLTQEAFARALARLEDFRGDAQPYTWLFRIAVNLAISRLRKEQRHRTFSLDGDASDGSPAARLPGSAPQPLEMMERRERDQQVLAALGRLDGDYRAVLIMRDIEGFDYEQMAQVLEIPLGTLKSRLFRARLALRDELKAYLGEGKAPAAKTVRG